MIETYGVRTEVIRYTDPTEGFRGFLAFHGDRHRLAAGGFRVQAGLRRETIAALAEAMTLKQRLLGLAVDGAKAGIDYDPRAPGKREAMRRFMCFLRPWLVERFSMGSDVGTTWAEIESLASEQGLLSAKAAVARAQGLEETDFVSRVRLLDDVIGGLTLGQRRAGHALAAAAIAAVARSPQKQLIRAGIQGFGTLARGAILSLSEAGVVIVAVADEHGCLVAPAGGLNVPTLLAVPQGMPLRGHASSGNCLLEPREALFDHKLDLIVLAACEGAVSEEQATKLRTSVVAVGANLALVPAVEDLLHRRDILVIPDFVGGCGGSASMDALFGSPCCPSPKVVLDQTELRMRGLVHQIFDLADRQGVTPRQAALTVCNSHDATKSRRPYGRWWSELVAPGGKCAGGDGAGSEGGPVNDPTPRCCPGSRGQP